MYNFINLSLMQGFMYQTYTFQRINNDFTKIMLRFALSVIAVFSGLFASAQNPTAGDCLGGFTVCAQSYNQQNSFVGEGNNLNEINPGLSCLASGERNNAWYIITVQNPGLFGFNIIPNCSNADYDWALYNITNNTCGDIATGLAPEVECNYQSTVSPTPVTGMNNGPNPQDEAMIAVQANQIFALCVNNFSGLFDCGYVLQFDIPGATADIIDDVPPQLNDVINVSCGTKILNFSFSEFVDCESVDLSDFLVVDPIGDTLDLISVVGIACTNGGEYEKDFTLVLQDPLNLAGPNAAYSFIRVGQVVDLCGNVAAGEEFEIFFVNGFDITLSSVTQANCPLINGAATIDVTPQGAPNPTDLYTYTWSPSGISAGPINALTHTANGLGYGTNIIEVVNQDGCTRSDTFEIEDQNNFAIDQIFVFDDTCSSGKGYAQIEVSGGDPVPAPPDQIDYTFFWENLPTPQGDTSGVGALLTGTYYFTVTDPGGCVLRDSVFIPDFRYSLSVDFAYSPDENPITGIFPTVSFINLSQFATEFIWDFGSGDSLSDFEPQYIFPGSGTYNVQLTAINQFGCRDSITKPITIDFFRTDFIPNSFSPNGDNINDRFKPIITGLVDSTFEMVVFNMWGEEVYSTKDIDSSWDGKSAASGKMLQDGVYVYKIYFIDQSGKKRQIVGRVTIFT
jgi:gliding motility-associated-like protein